MITCTSLVPSALSTVMQPKQWLRSEVLFAIMQPREWMGSKALYYGLPDKRMIVIKQPFIVAFLRWNRARDPYPTLHVTTVENARQDALSLKEVGHQGWPHVILKLQGWNALENCGTCVGQKLPLKLAEHVGQECPCDDWALGQN